MVLQSTNRDGVKDISTWLSRIIKYWTLLLKLNPSSPIVKASSMLLDMDINLVTQIDAQVFENFDVA